MHARLASLVALTSFSLGMPRLAAAEDAPAQAPASTGGAAAAPQAPPSTPAPAPSTPSGGAAVYTPPYGFPSSDFNPNSHLPTSSQPSTDINKPSDGFDLGPQGKGAGVMRGNQNGGLALVPERVAAQAPSVHTVKQGDTLWDICDHYFQNPWEWPRIWSYNPELQNPHWIYPGNQIHMLPGGVADATPAGENKLAATTLNGKFVPRKAQVPANTVFLRDQGYIDDDVKDVWGDIGGSPDDQMLLSQGDNVYLDIAPGHNVTLGQELTVFRPIPNSSAGGKGTLVAILGSARVEKWDPQTRVASARLTESLDVIERGAKVGPVTRRFEVVPPARNEVEVWAHVMASIYPHVLYGQNQVVFVDKGQKDGLAPGNRLFVVSRGDEYRKTLKGASQFAAAGVHLESDKPADIERDEILGRGDDKKYPEEVIGEIRVISVRDHTATCIVIASSREIERGQRIIARKGY